MTVERYCAVRLHGRVDILQLDNQCADWSAMRGASAVLDRAAVRQVYADLFLRYLYEGQQSAGDFCALLDRSAYTGARSMTPDTELTEVPTSSTRS